MDKNPVTEPPKESFLSILKSRWDHPLGGAYLLAWVIYNHDFLMVLFADASFNIKLAELNGMLPRVWEWASAPAYLRRMGVPLLFAFLYIALAPWSTPLQASVETKALNWARRIQRGMGKKFFSAAEFEVVETAATQAQEALTRATQQAAESKQDATQVRQAYLNQLRMTGQLEVDHRARRVNPPGRQFPMSGMVTPDLRQAIGSLAHFGITQHLYDIFRVGYEREINLQNGGLNVSFVDEEGGEPGFISDLNYLVALGLFDVLFTKGIHPTYLMNGRGRDVYEYLMKEHPDLLTRKMAP